MKYAQIKRKPFPYFFVDVSGWECYIKKISKTLYLMKEGNNMSRVKHLFAVALAALMLCLLMPISAFAEEASDGKMLIYAKLPSDWSAPHLWAWADDGTNAFDAWPGGEMEADSNNDGWYYCWIPETTNNIIINANEAAVQTGDYKLENKNAWVTVTDAENVEISYDAQTTGDLPEYVEKFKMHGPAKR